MYQHQEFQSPSEDIYNRKFGQSTFSGGFDRSGGFQTREAELSLQSSQPLRYSGSHFQATSVTQAQNNASTISLGKLRDHQQPLRASVNQPAISRAAAPLDDTRDRIVGMYKDEIKMHVARERDFQHLQDLISDLERRTRVFETGMAEAQRDHEDRLATQSKAINHHQGDIEALSRNVHEKQQEGIQVYEDIQGIKSDIQAVEGEIYSASRELEGTKQHNEQLRREIEFVQQDIFQAQDLKKRQQQSIYQLRNDLRFKEKECEDQKIKISMLDKEAKTLVDRTKHLNDQVDQKVIQVDKINHKLEGVDRDIIILKQNLVAIDVDINDVERSNDRALELQKKLLRQKDQEILKGQEANFHANQNDQKLKDYEIQIDHFKKDLDGVRFSNDALLDRNHDLKQELESLNQHADLLTSQNRELQRELDGFIETDDVVRRNLDRKDKVYNIRSKVDEVIKKSIQDLQSKSPPRNRGGQQYQAKDAQLLQREMPLHQNPLRQSYMAESINYRGSPLRRGQLDHYQ